MGIDQVTDLPSRVQYAASAAQTDFDYPFPIFQDADLVVVVDGVPKALSTDYSVSGEGDDLGGTVTFGSAMSGGEIVTIYRDIAIERLTDIQQNGPWDSSAYNDEQDKTYLLLKQLDDADGRALRIPVTAAVDDADIELTVANWSNKYVTIDADGKPTPAVLADQTMTQAIVGNLLFPRTAAEIAASVTPTYYYYPPGDVRRYGAALNGVTNDRAALVNAISQASNGGAAVYIPAGTLLVNSSFTVPGSVVIFGDGRARTIIMRGFTGDFITSAGGYHVLRDLTIDGDTATHGAGKGILMPSTTPGAVHTRIVVKNFVEPCLEFAADGGSTFRAMASNYQTTGAVLSVGAVTVNGTDSAATSRSFIGCESNGCTLYDFGGCDDFYVLGGYTGGVIFGTTSSKVLMSSVRIAGTGPSTIKGGSHQFPGCVFAYTPVVDASGQNVNLTGAELAGNDVTDSGDSTRYYGFKTYTPTMTADTTAPTIGNGTLNGLAQRQWNNCLALINIVWGSSSTYGVGQWYFSIPYGEHLSYKFHGTAYMKDTSTGFIYSGIARTIPSSQKVQVLLGDGTSGVLSPTAPFTWDTGDELSIELSYSAP